MPKTRSGVNGAAAGPTTQAAIKDLLGSLRPGPCPYSRQCLWYPKARFVVVASGFVVVASEAAFSRRASSFGLG